LEICRNFKKGESRVRKAQKIYFNGKGPFSSINVFTTRIGMIQHGAKVGVPFVPRTSEEEEFAEGVLNYHRIVEDPNYGSKKEE
jgi:hypothetical protein